MKEISTIETNFLKNLEEYKKQLAAIDKSFKVRGPKYLDFLLNNELTVISDQTGIISQIDVIKLTDIFAPYLGIIDELIIELQIGDYIPKYELLPNFKPKSILLKIRPKLSANKQELTKLSDFLEEKSKIIVEQFKIDKGLVYKTNLEAIRDLTKFYIYVANLESDEVKELVDELSSFLLEKVEHTNDFIQVREIGMTERLYLEIIKLFISNIRGNDLTKATIEAILSFIYSLVILASKKKSRSIMEGLLSLLDILLFNIIISGHRYRYYLSTLILFIKEISIQSITEKDLKKEEFLDFKDEYYLPIIIQAIDHATHTYFQLIQHFNEMGYEEGRRTLIANGNHLTDFLVPLSHWEPIDELQFQDDKSEEKYLFPSAKYLAKNLLYLSIYIFHQVVENELPKDLLFDVAFPLTDQCNTILKYHITNIQIIDELFFDNNFLYSSSPIASQMFESSIKSSPVRFYDFSGFWFAYSLYIWKRDCGFIPSKAPKDSRDKHSLRSLLNLLENINVEKFSAIFGTKYDIDKFVTEYKLYLESISKS